MAGNYPDVPAPRFAWDEDGCSVVTYDSTTGPIIAEYPAGDAVLVSLNDEGQGAVVDNRIYLVVVFPELRDISAYYLLGTKAVTKIESSTDTTNGLDGTWVTEVTGGESASGTTNMRDDIKTLSATGIKALRFHGASGMDWQVIHLYGEIATGESPDRLQFWHPTLDEEIDGAYFDWDDVARGESTDRDVRIKNNSSTLTAESVSVGVEALTDSTPSFAGSHTFSTDGGSTFGATASLGNLAPGGISSVFTVRRATTTDAQLSLWWARFTATATAWT